MLSKHTACHYLNSLCKELVRDDGSYSSAAVAALWNLASHFGLELRDGDTENCLEVVETNRGE